MEINSTSHANKYFVSNLGANFIFETNDWWIDFGVNIHVCFDRKLFSLF